MTNPKLGGKITPKDEERVNVPTEHDIVERLNSDDDHAKAQIRLAHAAAADQEKLTELKERYAKAILTFMWGWFAAVIVAVGVYFWHQITSAEQVPKEVIISLFTCTAVVVGLVGYILKGLFGSN